MRPLPLLLGIAILAGCGGGGSNSSDGKSRVTIDWPATDRAFEGSSLAGSAHVVFATPDPYAVVKDFLVVRPSGTSAVTKTYTLPEKVTPGTYVLSVTFCNGDAGDRENAVGFGLLAATVGRNGSLKDGDGEALPDVGLSSTLASIAVTAGQSVIVNEKKSLFVTATTRAGGFVNVPFGFLDFDVAQGGSLLRANDDGTVTGLAAGSATLVAKAFNLTSAAATVNVVTR